MCDKETIDTIALIHERTTGGIISKLKSLDILKDDDNPYKRDDMIKKEEIVFEIINDSNESEDDNANEKLIKIEKRSEKKLDDPKPFVIKKFIKNKNL